MKAARELSVFACAGIALLAVLNVAAAQTLAQDAFLNFEAICLSEINSPSKFVERVQEMGGVELPKALAKKLLEDHRGRMFRLKSEKQSLNATIGEQPSSCTIYSRDADGPATEAVFSKFIKHSALLHEAVGSEQFDYFAVTYNVNPSSPGHALVTVHYSKIIPGVQLAMMPESSILSSGMALPEWP